MVKHGLITEPNSFAISICKRQGNLFRASQYGFDSDAFDFISKFMNSEIAADMDDELSPCHIWGIKQMGETLLHLTDVQKHSGGYADADVLLVPIGGGHTINAAQAAEVISQVEPRIIIPMHYRPSDGETPDPLDKFCREMGVEIINTQPKLSITRNNLPAETQVVILESRNRS